MATHIRCRGTFGTGLAELRSEWMNGQEVLLASLAVICITLAV